MGQIIALANQKGGVGKTTSTLNLGAALHALEQRVLLVDLDPQGSLTTALGCDRPDDLTKTLFDAIQYIKDVGEINTIDKLPILTNEEGLDYIPCNIELSKAEYELLGSPGAATLLRMVLKVARNHYDYIFIDCPPSLGILTTNGLSAADWVIIPLQADYLALKGVYLMLQTIAKIKRLTNRTLQLGGIFMTMADLRMRHTKEIMAEIQAVGDGKILIFEALIRLNVSLKEAPIVGQSIFAYDPKSNVAVSYRALAQELLTVVQSGKEGLDD